MSSIVVGREVYKAARNICRNTDAILAVSYWGYGAVHALGIKKDSAIRIVLDVNSGATNPAELEYLRNLFGDDSRIHVHPDLHAKVYASNTIALIGSANASSSGLNIDLSGHAEVCVKIEGQLASEAYNHAFELFSDGKPINDEHIKNCRKRFGRSTVANIVTGKPGKVDLVDVLQSSPELIGSYPIIISDGDMTLERRKKCWEDSVQEIAPLYFGEPYENASNTWDFFDWEVDKRALGRTCISLHRDDSGKIYSSLIKCYSPRKGFTPCEFIDWSEIDCIKHRERTGVELKIAKKDRIYRSLNALIDSACGGLEMSGFEFARKLRE